MYEMRGQTHEFIYMNSSMNSCMKYTYEFIYEMITCIHVGYEFIHEITV